MATTSLAVDVTGVTVAGIAAMAGGTADPVIGGEMIAVNAVARRTCWRETMRWAVGPLRPLGPGMTHSWHPCRETARNL
jgi:hypothetical protein